MMSTPALFVRFLPRLALAGLVAALLAVPGCGGGGGGDNTPPPPDEGPPVNGPAWSGFGHDAQHTAVSAIATQGLGQIFWNAPLDLAPTRNPDGSLTTHYGSPLITSHNTVLMPVKTGSGGAFRVEARSGHTGVLRWSLTSDYMTPAHNWFPSFNPVLANGRLVMPMAGGRLMLRDDPESATGTTTTVAFYGDSAYNAAPATYNATVLINTGLTADSQGNVYFGFQVTGANPAGVVSGFARLGADGSVKSIPVATASGDASMVKPAMNGAPALSGDGRTLYVVVNSAATPPTGRLVALDSATMTARGSVLLRDPKSNAAAWVSDDSTASPTVGPDGDVYIGVLESPQGTHNFRGWLLHFDATLAQAKAPAAFGWDITASVVPKAMLGTQYTGSSLYLLMIKYNNYGGAAGGNGQNQVAIVDPVQTQTDTISGIPVMREVITKLGPTPDSDVPGGVKEWCINTAAVDPFTSSVLVNSEDGTLYRWHLPSNSFTERIALNNGIAESYTPTAVGADGRVYVVNNATLFSIGQ